MTPNSRPTAVSQTNYLEAKPGNGKKMCKKFNLSWVIFTIAQVKVNITAAKKHFTKCFTYQMNSSALPTWFSVIGDFIKLNVPN